MPSSLTAPKYNKLCAATGDELKLFIRHFCTKTRDLNELGNLVMILLLSILRLRTASLIALNIEDVDLKYGLLWVKEKGRQHRSILLPQSLCTIIRRYLQLHTFKKGPLLLSKRKSASPSERCRTYSVRRPTRTGSIKLSMPGCSVIQPPHI